jgi:hypothetical protein
MKVLANLSMKMKIMNGSIGEIWHKPMSYQVSLKQLVSLKIVTANGK